MSFTPNTGPSGGMSQDGHVTLMKNRNWLIVALIVLALLTGWLVIKL